MHYVTTVDIAARYRRDYRTATRWCQRRLFPNPRERSGRLHATRAQPT
jgi:hypothetical protein